MIPSGPSNGLVRSQGFMFDIHEQFAQQLQILETRDSNVYQLTCRNRTIPQILKIPEHYPNLVELTIYNCELPYSALASLIVNLPNLSKFYFRSPSEPLVPEMFNMEEQLGLLKFLSLPEINAPIADLEKLTNAIELNVDNVLPIYKMAHDNRLDFLEDRCDNYIEKRFHRSVKITYLTGCLRIIVNTLYPCNARLLKMLLQDVTEKIFLSVLSCNKEVLEALQTISGSVENFIQWNGELSSTIHYINGCRNLKKLSFYEVTLKEVTLPPISYALQELTVRQCKNFGDLALEQVCTRIPSLTTLTLIEPSITSNGLIPLKQVQKLERLTLQRCGLKDFALSFVAFNGNRLTHIHLEDNPELTDAGLWKLIVNCPRLQEVKVTPTRKINACVQQALGDFHPLKTDLTLDMSRVFSPTALDLILRRYRTIHTLKLQNCHTQQLFERLIQILNPQNNPHLRQITLQNCQLNPNEAQNLIKPKFPTLKITS